jgi:putative transposase
LPVARSTVYHHPALESAENLRLMGQIDELYLAHPVYDSRRMAVTLGINRKHAQWFMRLSQPAPGHTVDPYVLRGMAVGRLNQVWSGDITYIPLSGGFLCLMAIMDWYSRFVFSWELASRLGSSFCSAAFRYGQPEIWNSDQGSQFTEAGFPAPLQQRQIAIRGDGRDRALDNVFIERLWRAIEYERITRAT